MEPLQQIFPSHDILMNVQLHHLIKSLPSQHRRLELDILVSDLLIAFEYQGEGHYVDTFIRGSPPISVDLIKRKLCSDHVEYV